MNERHQSDQDSIDSKYGSKHGLMQFQVNGSGEKWQNKISQHTKFEELESAIKIPFNHPDLMQFEDKKSQEIIDDEDHELFEENVIEGPDMETPRRQTSEPIWEPSKQIDFFKLPAKKNNFGLNQIVSDSQLQSSIDMLVPNYYDNLATNNQELCPNYPTKGLTQQLPILSKANSGKNTNALPFASTSSDRDEVNYLLSLHRLEYSPQGQKEEAIVEKIKSSQIKKFEFQEEANPN